jgi:hypothetical protein
VTFANIPLGQLVGACASTCALAVVCFLTYVVATKQDVRDALEETKQDFRDALKESEEKASQRFKEFEEKAAQRFQESVNVFQAGLKEKISELRVDTASAIVNPKLANVLLRVNPPAK